MHKGLFRYNKLPLGVSSAPAVFQRCMESLFQGCTGVATYLDDTLVTGSTVENHLAMQPRQSFKYYGKSWLKVK